VIHRFARLSAALAKFLIVGTIVLIAGCSSPEDRAQGHYERGMKLLEEKDYVRASLEIRNAIKLKEDMAPAWVALSRIEEQNQNWESVGRILRRIVTLDPTNIDAKLRLTRLLLLAGNSAEALKIVDAGIAIDKNSSALTSLKAAILFKMDDRNGAVREAEAALSMDPENFEALIVLSANRLARGDSEGALSILERKGEGQDKNVGVQLFKLKILETRGDLPKIEAILLKLIEHYPQEQIFRRQLIKFYLDQNRQIDAEKQLLAIVKANPADTKAGVDLVRYLQATKGPEAAHQQLVRLINEGGNVFSYQMALADFHLGQGAFDDGVRLLETISRTSSSQENAHAAKIRLAEVHFSMNRLAEAEALVADVLDKDRRNVGGLKLRATIRMNKGQLDDAIADLREALNDKPQASDLLLLLATAFERAGSIELAEDRFVNATKVSNFEPTVGLQYVAFLQRRGNLARAEDMLLQLADRRKDNLGILTTLAQVKLARRDWIGAQEISDSILRLGDNPGVANQILAESLAGQKKHGESIAVLEGVYEATPEAAQPMFALVRAYVRAEKLDAAESFLNSILKENPKNAEAHVLMGSVKLTKNEPKQALQSFRTAIKEQPKNVSGYRALANYHMRNRENDEAEKVIRAAMAEQPESIPMRLMLAQVHEINKDFEAAITEYEFLLQRQPGSAVVANNLASLLLDHRTDAASLEKAGLLAGRLRKSPVAQFKDTLGWLHYRKGEYKAAIAILQEAAAELPGLPVVHYHLGVSYVADGQNEKGAERLKKALELLPNGGVSEEAIRAALKKSGSS
jgi:tetratricopeptide (TPR) repeat protein